MRKQDRIANQQQQDQPQPSQQDRERMRGSETERTRGSQPERVRGRESATERPRNSHRSPVAAVATASSNGSDECSTAGNLREP